MWVSNPLNRTHGNNLSVCEPVKLKTNAIYPQYTQVRQTHGVSYEYGSSKRRKDWSQHSEAKLNFSWSRRRHGRGENCILAKGVACEDMCEDGKDCGVQLTPGSARVCRSSGGRRVRGCDEARQGAWAGAQQAEVVASPFSFVYGKWVNNCIFFFKHT